MYIKTSMSYVTNILNITYRWEIGKCQKKCCPFWLFIFNETIVNSMLWHCSSPAHKKWPSNYYAILVLQGFPLKFSPYQNQFPKRTPPIIAWDEPSLVPNLSKESMLGKASMLQRHNLLLEFYFKFFCSTSNVRSLLLLILFFPIDISYNKIVLFVSMCIKSNQDRLVTVCSRSNLVYLRTVLIRETQYRSTTVTHH